MRVRIEIESIEKDGDKVFGNIYFNDQSFYFPSNDWNDFLIIILNWWCSAMGRLLRNENIQDEFSFMDGPFTVKVAYIKEGVFNLSFFSLDTLKAVYEVPIRDFSNDFLKEVNLLIRRLNQYDWNNDEIENLKTNHRNLKAVLKNVS